MQYTPIERPPMQPQPEKSGISITSAVFIAILVAATAFMGGIRFDEFQEFRVSDASEESENLPDDLDYSSVEKVYDRLRKNFDGDLNERDLLNGLKAGLAEASGDPYTVFLTTDQAEQFDNDLNGTFTGIGAEIGIENDALIVVAPLDGFPAQKAGLQPKDIILAINDEDALSLSVEEAVLKIRGPAGSEVKLTLIRDGERVEVTIVREEIKLPSVTTEVADGIGYLRISRFADDTSLLVQQAVDEFRAANVTGIILDLRNNSGGFLNAAVDVASLWVDGLPIVDQRENDGKTITETLRAQTGAPFGDIETVILINEGSASASEIVAGALQDYELAVLIGETSFGKGSVQSLETFSDKSVLKVTTARWYTPNGRNIDSEGIAPNIELKLTAEDIEAERDTQRQRAEEVLNN